MKKIQNLIPLKVISYILIPVLILNILINIFSIELHNDYGEDFHENMKYIETEKFANNFLYCIYGTIAYYQGQYGKDTIEVITDSEDNTVYETSKVVDENNGIIYRSSRYNNDLYDYVIIDDNGIVYTNIEKTIRNR